MDSVAELLFRALWYLYVVELLELVLQIFPRIEMCNRSSAFHSPYPDILESIEESSAAIERHKTLRMAGPTIHGRRPRPATLNRELACLKRMFNVARKGLIELKGGGVGDNPVSPVTFLDEQNVRSRVLTPEEFQRMLNVSPDDFKPAHSCGYYTGIRREGIFELT